MKRIKYQAPSIETIELEAESMMIVDSNGGLSEGGQDNPSIGGRVMFFRKADGIISDTADE